MNRDDRVGYLQAIWETFQKKAGICRGWSSAEYDIAAKWADRNVPLPIVERGIGEFNGVPRRLEAVVPSVERCYAYNRKASGLGPETIPEEWPL